MHRDLSAEQLKQSVTLTLPLSAVLLLAERREAAPAAAGAIAGIVVPELAEGEAYAGILLRDGLPLHHVVLLAGDEKMSWKEAIEWAKARGGALPTRKEQSLLFANCGALFQNAYYWSSEEFAGDADCAWYQSFGNGLQGFDHKGDSDRCRAVRRVPI